MAGYIKGIKENYSNSGMGHSHGYVYYVDVSRLNGWMTSFSNDISAMGFTSSTTTETDFPLWETTYTHKIEFSGENKSWDEHPEWQSRRQYEAIRSLDVNPTAYEMAVRCLFDSEEMVRNTVLPDGKRWTRTEIWWACSSLQKLGSGEIGGCTVDNYGGRFYTVLTGMGKDYRKTCLTWDGKRICEADIRSAQPTFLGMKIKQESGRRTVWLEKCLDGTFYEWIREITGTTVERGKLKKYLMKYMYSCCKDRETSAEQKKVYRKGYKRFEQRLHSYLAENEPEIYALLERHKQNPEWSKDKKKWSNTLPRELTLMETAYIRRCIADIPEHIPFFTIHDCICCKQTDSQEVKEIMETVGREMYGESIWVKTE